MANEDQRFSNISFLYYRFWMCFILMVFAISAFGQDYLLIKEGKKYRFNGLEYKINELGTVYGENEEALKLYNDGMRAKSRSQIMAAGGLMSFLAGLVIYVNVSEENKAYGGWMMIAGVVLEPLALGLSLNGSIKLVKARKVFNEDLLEKRKYKSNSSLSIGSTKNGIGLTLIF